MKRLLISVLTLVIAVGGFAQPIPVEKARQVASAFLKEHGKKVDVSRLDMVYSQKLAHFDHEAFYVFSEGRSAFVIVAGDEVAMPILGYSMENGFPAHVPCNVQDFLSDLTHEIDYMKTAGYKGLSTKGKQALEGDSSENYPSSVAPLLTTKWSQGTPYNGMCPADNGNSSGHAVTGCVATAMAQVIKYHNYPVRPRGKHGYQSTYGWLEADFDNVNYNFGLMPDSPNSSSPMLSQQAVQELMFHCGVSVGMEYSASESLASIVSTRMALVSFFRYSAQASCAQKSKYSSSAWVDLLKNEIVHQRPVIYRGTGVSGGHAFVCDGYNENNQFHFNFGWGGNSDGYYSLSAINPGTHNYTSTQYAIIGIEPDSSSNVILPQSDGVSRYIVEDTLRIYDVTSTNTSSFGFQISHYNKSIFYPSNPQQQLVLVPIYETARRVWVADGSTGDTLLINASGSANINIEQQYTNNHCLSVIDTHWNSSYGFMVYADNGCRKPSGLSAYTSNDTVFLSWHENGEAQSWQIEYGPVGFAHGNGTIVGAMDTITMIPNIPFGIAYDFYVRSYCGLNQDEVAEYGEWSERLTRTIESPYWADKVVHQPSGYQILANGDVEISSTEGLAWLISVVNGLNGQQTNSLVGKIVTLTADVDMGLHDWTGINNFAGTFDGAGHSIRHLHGNQGLFGQLHSDQVVLKDIHLQECNVVGGFDAGGLCDYMFYGTITNCTWSGAVSGNSAVGGLVGDATGVTIEHCTTSGSVNAECGVCGGLIGNMISGHVSNSASYAAVESVPDGEFDYIFCGRNAVGLIGKLGYMDTIENCVFGGYVHGQFDLGGLIGIMQRDAYIRNCYYSVVPAPIVANDNPITYDSSAVNYCYSPCDDINFVTQHCFSHNMEGSTLSAGVTIGDSICYDLLTALNQYVVNKRDTALMLWEMDSNNYPALSGRYVQACPAVTGVLVDSTFGDGVRLSWSDDGSGKWQVKLGNNDLVMQYVDQPTATINGLDEGAEYTIYVRSVCEEGFPNEWSSLNFVFCQERHGNITVQACDSVSWNGMMYTESANIQDTALLSSGCDSITHVQLVVHHTEHMSQTVTACDFHLWNDSIYTQSGFFQYSHVDANGCFQTDTLHLTVKYSTEGTDSVFACNSYTWDNDVFLTSTDTLMVGFTNSQGCDSLLHLHVTIANDVTVFDTLAVSPYEIPYMYGDNVLATAGLHNFTYTATNGCDSTLHLSLVTDSALVSVQTLWSDVVTSQPEGYVVGEDMNVYIYSREGLAWLISVCNHLNNAPGMSVRTKTVYLMADVDMSGYLWTPIDFDKNLDGRFHKISGITIRESNQSTCGFIKAVFDTVCNVEFVDCDVFNEYAHAPVGCIAGMILYNGIIFNCGLSGVVRSSVEYGNAGGFVGTCDGKIENSYSIATVLSRNSAGGMVGTSSYSPSLFKNCYSAGMVGATSFDPSNIGVFIGESNDSTHLAYWLQRDNNMSGSGNNASGFYPFVWNGNEWALTSPMSVCGQNVMTLVDALNAWVDSNNTDGIYRRWTIDSTGVNQGLPIFEEARYSLLVQCNDNAMGSVSGGGQYFADDIAIISATANACHYFVQWSDGDANPIRSLTVSCDTSFTAIFAANPPIVHYADTTVCDTFLWKGFIFVDNGMLYDSLTTGGCDSVVALELTVYHSNLTGSDTVFSCSSYLWNGETYDNSGIYEYGSLKTSMGCDSMATLVLTVSSQVIATENVTSCDQYSWHGSTYTHGGIYSDTSSSVAGCDSVTTLVLTLYNSQSVDTFAVACDNFVWRGMTYTDNGVFIDTSISSLGCDSITTLSLSINSSKNVNSFDTACNQYTWDGHAFTESGIYHSDTLKTAQGCDSTITLYLTLYRPKDTVMYETACDTFTWNGFGYYESGVFSYSSIDANGCPQHDTLYLTINHSTESWIENRVQRSTLPYYFQDTIITDSGNYDIHLINDAGCDSVLHLRVVVVEDVGVELVEENDNVVVYPNPVDKLLFISSPQPILYVEIYDEVGRCILKSYDSSVLNMSGIPQGVYSLRIVLLDSQSVRKVIKR